MQVEPVQNIEAVFLDVDGTLYSSEPIILDIYRQCFTRFQKEYGMPATIPTLDQIMEQIGRPIREIFANLAGDMPVEKQEKLGESILHELVAEISKGKGQHYPGTFETVRSLKDNGYRIFAASNGRYPYIEAILKYAGIFSFFEDVTAVDNKKIFDKNQLVQTLLQEFHIEPSRAIVVGDRKSDRDAAFFSGAHFIACSYGHGSPAEWEGAIAVIDSFENLLDFLPEKSHAFLDG